MSQLTAQASAQIILANTDKLFQASLVKANIDWSLMDQSNDVIMVVCLAMHNGWHIGYYGYQVPVA